MNALTKPLQPLLKLFSSIWLGVTLLTVLFFYSSVGSAGILYPTSLNFLNLDNWDQIVPRQAPGLEMTEFEWFHWWPFNLLIFLICTNLIVATIRRIPFKPVNFGVLMIHAGIITLAIGSVWYFGTKVEGDSPIFRRNIAIRVPGAAPLEIAAKPGNRAVLQANGQPYSFQVVEVNPSWELLTGDEVGKRVYSVSVMVQTPEQQFIRQLLVDRPELTEDVIPGQGRAVKVVGKKILDDSVQLSLEYAPQPWFYLVHSEAIYVRRLGDTRWVERPVRARALPRYNDYVASLDEVWCDSPDSMPKEAPLSLEVSAVDESDPLAGTPVNVRSYLRYAGLMSRRSAGGDSIDPFAVMNIRTSDGQSTRVEMLVNDPSTSSDAATFKWIEQEDQLQSLSESRPGALTIRIPDLDVEQTYPTSDLPMRDPEGPFMDIEGTPYSFRVLSFENNLPLQTDRTTVSVALVDFKTPEGEFNRWVFDDARRNRDQVIDPSTGQWKQVDFDTRIEAVYQPPVQPPFITLVAGPDESQLRLLLRDPDTNEMRTVPAKLQDRVSLNADVDITIERYEPRSTMVSKPFVVGKRQRQRNLDMQLRMVRVEIPGALEQGPIWLEYHPYAFESEFESLRGYPFRPTKVTMQSGDVYELLFSRARLPLPAPAVLTDFQVAYHTGGYSGDTNSVMNWESVVQFDEGDSFSDVQAVAVNRPGEYHGYWFYQAQWDPPDPSSGYAGLNHTVLGVGNRRGVYMQLLGCTIAVIGMIYAFYVKPGIKRRHQRAALELAAASDSRSKRGAAVRPSMAEPRQPAGTLASVLEDES